MGAMQRVGNLNRREGRKEFHFDLDMELLKQNYPSQNGSYAYKSAWSDIREFLEENGFFHTQYSGYESKTSMSYMEAFDVIDRMNEKLPWFVLCAKAATLTEIGLQHDVLQYLRQEESDWDEWQRDGLSQDVSDESACPYPYDPYDQSDTDFDGR